MTCYETLGVCWAAKEGDIRQRYYELARKNHPDWGGDTSKFAEITFAFNKLKDRIRRNAYNHELKRTHKSCAMCRGTGVGYKQRGFTQKTVVPCAECNGVGLVEKV